MQAQRNVSGPIRQQEQQVSWHIIARTKCVTMIYIGVIPHACWCKLTSFFLYKTTSCDIKQCLTKEREIAQASKCSHDSSLFVTEVWERERKFSFFYFHVWHHCFSPMFFIRISHAYFKSTLPFFPVLLARSSFVKWYISPNYSSSPSHPGCTYNHQHAAADPAASASAVPGTADEAAASFSFLLLFFLGWSASSRWPCLQ